MLLSYTSLLLRSTAEYGDPAISFRYFHWRKELKETAFDDTVRPEGSALLSALAPLWETETAVLLLSDGFFSSDEIAEYVLPKICTLKAIAVGGDADEYKLEKLAGRGNVYAPEDLFAAIEAAALEGSP